MTSRAAQVVPLLLQSPPGQVPSVYDDLIGLVGSDGADADNDVAKFETLAAAARAEYNEEQHVVVDLPLQSSASLGDKNTAAQGKAILCKSAAHPGDEDRYMAPRQKISFKVNHATLVTSEPRPYLPNQKVEAFRAELEKMLSVYIQDKYATGVVEVFAVSLPRKKIQVPEPVMREAIAKDAEQDASMAAASTEDLKEVSTDDSKKTPVDIQATADEDGQATEGATIADVKDDPEEVAEAIKEVEETKNEQDTNLSEQESSAKTGAPDTDEETHGETELVIHIVANKYKLSNFWSGRWRSTYTLSNTGASTLNAHANAQVHYFEEGNVQLHTKKASELKIDAPGGDESAYVKSIVRAIQTFEDEYERELFKNSSDLGEGAFKALRRQLPMTRQKIDWDKVLNYKLGSELSKT